MAVGMLAMARLADNFHHLAVYKARHGMVQEQPAARAIIINGIAESWVGFIHQEFTGRPSSGERAVKRAHYNPLTAGIKPMNRSLHGASAIGASRTEAVTHLFSLAGRGTPFPPYSQYGIPVPLRGDLYFSGASGSRS